jgi:hypothetical protein
MAEVLDKPLEMPGPVDDSAAEAEGKTLRLAHSKPMCLYLTATPSTLFTFINWHCMARGVHDTQLGLRFLFAARLHLLQLKVWKPLCQCKNQAQKMRQPAHR